MIVSCICCSFYNFNLLLSLGDTINETSLTDQTNKTSSTDRTDNKTAKGKSEEQLKEEQEEFNAHLQKSVIKILADYKMDVEERSRKRSVSEANEPSESQGLLSFAELVDMEKGVAHSKFYQGEDDGLQIPELHPYYNLPVSLQMMILDLPADKFDECLDHIASDAPKP